MADYENAESTGLRTMSRLNGECKYYSFWEDTQLFLSHLKLHVIERTVLILAMKPNE
jgi:hypothetical protein